VICCAGRSPRGGQCRVPDAVFLARVRRADNALALAAEAGRFDQLRAEMFADQPGEGTGGYRADDLIELGVVAGSRAPNTSQACAKDAMSSGSSTWTRRFSATILTAPRCAA